VLEGTVGESAAAARRVSTVASSQAQGCQLIGLDDEAPLMGSGLETAWLRVWCGAGLVAHALKQAGAWPLVI
jgi:hypothetical protein